jgi:hypothetical protein
MKLRLINSYNKRRSVKDPLTGKPVIDPLTGKEKKEDHITKMYRYAVAEATPEEAIMYKKFKLQDGPYYKEELIEGKKRAVWHGEFIGKEIVVNGYKREDGRIGFSADTTESDVLLEMARKYPGMAATFEAQAAALALSGRKWNLEDKETDSEEDETTSDEFTNFTEESPATDPATEGSDEGENAE